MVEVAKQIGNAVPPLVAYALAIMMMSDLGLEPDRRLLTMLEEPQS